MLVHDLENRVRKLEALSAFSQELRFALQYIQSDAASSLTKSRVVLEKVLVQVYTVEMGREPPNTLVGGMLSEKQFTRKIERRILSRMDAIRNMTNLGPHGEAVEANDAARVLDDLCEVLEWYLRKYSAYPSSQLEVGGGSAEETEAKGNAPHYSMARKAEKLAVSSMIYGGLGWWTGERLACFSRRWSSEDAPDSLKASPLAHELAKKFVAAHLDDLSTMFCCGPLPEIAYGTYFGLDCAAGKLTVDVGHFQRAARALEGTLFKAVPILTDPEAFALLLISVGHARNIVEADYLAGKPFPWQNVEQLYEHSTTKVWGSESLAPLYTTFFRCLEEFLAVDAVCNTSHFDRSGGTTSRNNNDILRTLYAAKYLQLGPDEALVRWSNADQTPLVLAPSTTTLPLAARLTAAIIVMAFDERGKPAAKLPLPVAAVGDVACDAMHSALVDVYRSLVALVATRLSEAATRLLLLSSCFRLTIDGVEVVFDPGGAVIPEALSDTGEILIDAACADYIQRIAAFNLPPRVTLYDVLRYFRMVERHSNRSLWWMPHEFSFADRLRIATRVLEPIFSLCVVADPPPFLR